MHYFILSHHIVCIYSVDSVANLTYFSRPYSSQVFEGVARDELPWYRTELKCNQLCCQYFSFWLSVFGVEEVERTSSPSDLVNNFSIGFVLQSRLMSKDSIDYLSVCACVWERKRGGQKW